MSAAAAPPRPMSMWWAVGGCIAVPLIAAALSRDRFTSSIIAAAAVQGLFAVSWVPLAATGQPSLGHALPYGAGAYAAAFLARSAGLHPGDLAGLVPLMLAVTAALAGACCGGLQGRLTRRLTPVFVAVVTLGIVEAARSLATMWTAPLMRGVAEAGTAIPITAFPNDDRMAVWVAAAAFAAGVLAVAALERSRTGVALRTAAGNEREAAALGFDPPRLRLAAFFVAGTIAGVAGALSAQFSGRVSPAMFSWHTSLFVPAAALIGGPVTAAGPAAAGFVIAALAQFLDVPAGIQLLAFAGVLAAAGLRDPRHVLGPAFSWNPRPAPRGGDARRSGMLPLVPLPAGEPIEMQAENGGAPLLRLDGVSVRAGAAWPLREITIHVAPGEAVGVCGPRRSGKTALLDVISGFLPPERGRVTFVGQDVAGWAAHRIARAGVARSFQTPPLVEGTVIQEAVAAAAIGRGLGARATREAVRRALVITGLEAVAHDVGAALDPAGQRLLALARVAAAAPRLALLDEPLAGLPPEATGAVVSALRGLHALGVTLIVTAHDPASLRAVCSRAVLIRDGRIVGAGRPAAMRRA